MSDDKNLTSPSDSRNDLASSELVQRGLELADRLTTSLTEADDKKASDYFWYAAICFFEDDLERAYEALDHALGLNPRRNSTWGMRGHVRHLLGDLRGAAHDFERLIHLEPDESEPHIDLAIVCSDMKHFEKAQTHFRVAWNKLHVPVQARRKFSVSPRRNRYGERWSEAAQLLLIEMFEQFKGGAEAEWHRRVADRNHEWQQRLEENLRIIVECTRQIQTSPNCAELFYRRGCARDNYGAITDLHRAIRLNPSDAEAYASRSDARRSLDDAPGCYLDLETAIKLMPASIPYRERLEQILWEISKEELNVADLLNNRGWQKKEHGDLAGALNDLGDALRRNPQHALAFNNRGVVYGRLDNHNAAIADYNHATQIAPHFTWPYMNRGEIFFELGLYDMALTEFTRAVELEPDYCHAIAGQAVTLHVLSEVDRAVVLWRKLLGIDARYNDYQWIETSHDWDISLVTEAQKLILRVQQG